MNLKCKHNIISTEEAGGHCFDGELLLLTRELGFVDIVGEIDTEVVLMVALIGLASEMPREKSWAYE